MGVSIQDRTDFLNMLDACRTEQQLFSRLTFAVMFHQTDPAAREDLLDDVRGAACNMQLPAVNYKIDQWLNTCKQAWQADPADARSLGSRTNFISAPPGSPSGA